MFPIFSILCSPMMLLMLRFWRFITKDILAFPASCALAWREKVEYQRWKIPPVRRRTFLSTGKNKRLKTVLDLKVKVYWLNRHWLDIRCQKGELKQRSVFFSERGKEEMMRKILSTVVDLLNKVQVEQEELQNNEICSDPRRVLSCKVYSN